MQGRIGPAELIDALTAAANEHGAELVAERAEASERVPYPVPTPASHPDVDLTPDLTRVLFQP